MKKLMLVLAATALVSVSCADDGTIITTPTGGDYSCEARTEDIMNWLTANCGGGIGACANPPRTIQLRSGNAVTISQRGNEERVNVTDIPPGSIAGDSCPRIYGLDGPHGY